MNKETAGELYDIIDHCRTDTLDNFIEDLMRFLDEITKEQTDD